MTRRIRTRVAAGAALLAMALHALSPLAAPAPRDGAQALHDICSSAPAAPQPAGDPSTSHCALCVQPASMAPRTFAALEETGFSYVTPLFFLSEPSVRLAYSPSRPRPPPASA
jgi:hypothetical protein